MQTGYYQEQPCGNVIYVERAQTGGFRIMHEDDLPLFFETLPKNYQFLGTRWDSPLVQATIRGARAVQ